MTFQNQFNASSKDYWYTKKPARALRLLAQVSPSVGYFLIWYLLIGWTGQYNNYDKSPSPLSKITPHHPQPQPNTDDADAGHARERPPLPAHARGLGQPADYPDGAGLYVVLYRVASDTMMIDIYNINIINIHTDPTPISPIIPPLQPPPGCPSTETRSGPGSWPT